MRYLLAAVLFLALCSCSVNPVKKETQSNAQPCLGSSELPANLRDNFESVEDDQLLKKALGDPRKGKLCQGQVYKSKAGSQITVFRAWNSTNPNSKYGKWWAFEKPAGKISAYRSEYEICYQWSPLDKLAKCTLKPEIKVVAGTGQSAECSEYLTYPVSDKLQVFIDNASKAFTRCSVFDGEFSWK
jgi:hypothetical protein